jgi:aminoglycoside 6-adenylyltransferase
MRSEKEMLDLILTTAREDDRIRAVVLNGSRASPTEPRDPFQDFDVVYAVRDPAPFTRNREWINRFGGRMILQLPDDMGGSPPRVSGSYAYLMQFADGNRIDLTVCPLEGLGEIVRDSRTVVLLDKDGILKDVPEAHDGDYLPSPPSAKAFADCCNEFWWLCPYVAKGLWRREIPYAKFFQESGLRGQLFRMIDWYIGVRTDFRKPPGKYGRHYRRHLEPGLWKLLEATYSDADIERNWDALLAAGELFRRTALPVAERFGFEYPHGDDRRVTDHLHHVRALPADAAEIY